MQLLSWRLAAALSWLCLVAIGEWCLAVGAVFQWDV